MRDGVKNGHSEERDRSKLHTVIPLLSFSALEGNSEAIVRQQNVQYYSRTALWSTKGSVSSTTSVFDDFTSPRFNQ